METSVYNQKGEKVDAMDLPESVFGVKMNPDLVYQVAVTQAANRRRVTAHTKDRGEVSGGGKNLGARKAPAGRGTVPIVRRSGGTAAWFLAPETIKSTAARSTKKCAARRWRWCCRQSVRGNDGFD